MGWAEPKGLLHDAARKAALAERDRLHLCLSDYHVGRIAMAAVAVVEGSPDPPPPTAVIDVTAVPS